MHPDAAPSAQRPASARPAPWRGWARWAGVGVVLALSGVVLARLAVRDDPSRSFCVFLRVTGVPCMTCGMTRASAHLAKGEWREALVRHPLAPVVVAEVALAWLAWPAVLLGWLRRPKPALVRGLVLVNVLALVLTWLVRLVSDTLPP